ncbi:MAG: pyridoxamine 5'-phosphate oxidase family protein [Actinomycetota bacterium]|nr:pyridoxamine 5'-phosphate oxidase family protein [Actinomycetota bacterium]
MTTWEEFAAAEPDFADRVRRVFQTQKHMTLATLRRDGSPRISGTEAAFDGRAVRLGMMPNSRKSLDLLQDPRLALHSPTIDPPSDAPQLWAGDAKITGRAKEIVTQERAEDASHSFEIDITEVVLTKVGAPADHLVIESWTARDGHRTRRRN